MTPTTLDGQESMLQTDLPKVNQREPVASSQVSGRPSHSTVRRMKYLSLWSRQLYVLVHSGTPLAEAMHAVEQQASAGHWRNVLMNLRQQIAEGTPLSEAMYQHPAYFNAVCRNLIAAGESSGTLPAMLERLSRLTRWQLSIRRKLVGALVYPSLLIVLALAVLLAMICIVLPRFEGLFATLDAPMPPSTQILISLSEILRAQWWMILGLLALLGFGIRLYTKSPRGRRMVDHLKVYMPWAGAIFRGFLTARMARLLGELLQSQVPLLDSLTLTRQAAGNALYADLLQESQEAVIRGERMSGVLRRAKFISPSLAEAMRHAEDNAQIGPVLIDMADFMDEENETTVRTLTSILEPMILVVLGGLVAFVALSMFLPLFDLTSMA
jgi:type II secretory pathway component PulF